MYIKEVEYTLPGSAPLLPEGKSGKIHSTRHWIYVVYRWYGVIHQLTSSWFYIIYIYIYIYMYKYMSTGDELQREDVLWISLIQVPDAHSKDYPRACAAHAA